MNQTKFDKLILNNLIDKYGKNLFGYRTIQDNTYDVYYKKEEFEQFTNHMPIKHYHKYYHGQGGELFTTTYKGVIRPPKMASVGSSSRFCYLALCNGAPHIQVFSDVTFEHECKIKNKSSFHPQLDAFSASSNTYVEVKCHEIFNTDKEKSLGKSYADYIYDTVEGIGFNFDINKKPDSKFEIPYTLFGLAEFPKYFDLKQFLCHLLGIACQNKGKEESATLAYLFFRPKTSNDSLNAELLSVFTKLQAEIISIFTSQAIKDFCKENNIVLKAYYEYSEVMEQLTASNTHPLFS